MKSPRPTRYSLHHSNGIVEILCNDRPNAVVFTEEQACRRLLEGIVPLRAGQYVRFYMHPIGIAAGRIARILDGGYSASVEYPILHDGKTILASTLQDIRELTVLE